MSSLLSANGSAQPERDAEAPAELSEAAKASPEGSLYPRLWARRSGLSQEQVTANQRLRLQGAMVEAVARYGYAGTTVDQVVKLAGVSTRTLYERFSSKQGCFLATYDWVVEQAQERIAKACWDGEGHRKDGRRALADGVAAVCHEIAAHPKECMLALVEAPSIGPIAKPAIARVQQNCEQMLFGALCRAAGGPLPPLIAQGAAHGLFHLARICLIEQRPERFQQLQSEILHWLQACASLAAAELRRGGQGAREAPLGATIAASKRPPVTTSKRLVAADSGRADRERVLRIAAEIVARGGLQAASIVRICEEADVDLDAFLAEHSSVEGCLCAALELLGVEALASGLQVVEEPPRDAEQWCVALHEVIAGIYARIAADHVLQRFVFVEMPESGLTVFKRQTELMRRFAWLLMRRSPRATKPPRGLVEALVGAVWGIAADHIAREEAHLLPARAAYASYLVLAPLVGSERAVAAIRSGGESAGAAGSAFGRGGVATVADREILAGGGRAGPID